MYFQLPGTRTVKKQKKKKKKKKKTIQYVTHLQTYEELIIV